MGFSANKHQQLCLDDNFNQLTDRTKKFILNSWAGAFAKTIFLINEERFSVLYSSNAFQTEYSGEYRGRRPPLEGCAAHG